MATSATHTLQLTQAQTDTTTPTLATRKLARFLSGFIQFHSSKELFDKVFAKGADIDFSGPDDHNEHLSPPIFDAITYSNTWAFDELLKRGADINKTSTAGYTPLFDAVAEGNVYMVRKLLAKKADHLDFLDATCLSPAIEAIKSSVLVESRWRYEDEPLEANNTELKHQISKFFLQEDEYFVPSRESHAIPFITDTPERIMHVHYDGKEDILSLLLNRQVSPLIPVAGTTRSPLEVVRNPKKYSDHFRSDPKEELEYIGTEDGEENTLLFTMKLVNKRNTGSLPTKIIIHYDLEPSKRLIEGAVAHLNPSTAAFAQSFSRKMEYGIRENKNDFEMQFSGVHGRLAAVQVQLLDVRVETAEVAQAVTHVGQAVQKVRQVGHFDEKEEIERFTSLIKGHPNAEEAYKCFQIGLEAIRTGALAVKSGAVVVTDGSLALVASALGMGKELANMIPIVGPAASTLLGWASSATMKIDGMKQTNIFENIAAMVTKKEAGKTFEAVARKLTMAYFRQFEALATKEAALQQQQMSRASRLVSKTKEKVINSRFISPAEQVAAFAIIWMIDDVFYNAHLLEAEIKNKGLEAVLLNAVTQRQPAPKLSTLWDTLTTKLGINAIPTVTESGAVSTETWQPADFWTAPGVAVQNNDGFQYFVGSNSDVAKYGWRLGRPEDVQALGLTQTMESTPSHSPTSRLTPMSKSKPTTASSTGRLDFAPPGRAMVYAYPNMIRPSTPTSPSTEPLEFKPESKRGTPEAKKPPVTASRFSRLFN